MPQTTHYFTNCLTLDALTKERNRLAHIHHPDVGGKVEVMQDINAQFDQAKKRLSAPPAQRVYACPKTQPAPRPAMNYEEMQRWAKEKERERLKAEVARQRNNLRNEMEWAREELRKMQKNGELRDCRISMDTTNLYLAVIGKNTYQVRAKLKGLGFWWSDEYRHWYFHKRPVTTNTEQEQEQKEDDGYYDN